MCGRKSCPKKENECELFISRQKSTLTEVEAFKSRKKRVLVHVTNMRIEAKSVKSVFALTFFFHARERDVKPFKAPAAAQIKPS